MAHAAIVPQLDLAASTAHIHAELSALAAEFQADVPALHPVAANCQAFVLLDDLQGYATGWDRHAFLAGNDDACPF